MTPIDIILTANALIASVNQLLSFAERLRAQAKERGEWTDEQELEFDNKLAALKGPNAPAHWVPEVPQTTGVSTK